MPCALLPTYAHVGAALLFDVVRCWACCWVVTPFAPFLRLVLVRAPLVSFLLLCLLLLLFVVPPLINKTEKWRRLLACLRHAECGVRVGFCTVPRLGSFACTARTVDPPCLSPTRDRPPFRGRGETVNAVPAPRQFVGVSPFQRWSQCKHVESAHSGLLTKGYRVLDVHY